MDEISVEGNDALETEYDEMTAILAGEGANITSDINGLISSLDTLSTELSSVISNVETAAASSATISTNIAEIATSIESIKSGLNQIETNANTINALAGENIENEFEIQINEIVSSSDKSLFMFPYYLVLLILFVGMMLASNLIIIEKQSLAFFRNHTSPTSDVTHLLARFTTNFIILLLQVAAVLAAGYFLLDIPIFDNYAVTATILLLTITFFIFLGYLIGYLFKTQEGMTIAFISIGSISAFLSNLILPIETFSYNIRTVLMYNPYVLCSELLKKSLVFNTGFVQLGTELWALVGYVSIIILTVLILQQVSLSQFSFNMSKRSVLKRSHITRDNKFKLNDGTLIEDLEELSVALQEMEDEEFRQYGLRKNNEFALWIKDIFKLKSVAKKISRTDSRKEAIRIIEEFLEEQKE